MVLEIITAAILIIGTFNLFRLSALMVASDVYDLRRQKQFKNRPLNKKLPKISVLIPAYNEESGVAKTVRSVLAAKYKRKEIIVINDGSTDCTKEAVEAVQKRFSRSNITLINKENGGKGSALNEGIKHADGELIMVLDADSKIAQDALRNSVKYFDDKRVKAIASNVRLNDNGTWLCFLQRVEYLLAYRMKRSLTALNMEYIIGGVGSIYRASTLRQVSGYRHNTITEDIDLSMKVVTRGNKAYRVIFASDVRTSTEPVLNIKDLIKQRYRWKFGRLQAFLRYKHLFFSTNKKHGKMLSWFQFPYAIFGELYLILEPLFIVTIVAVAIIYGDLASILMAVSILGIFMIFNFIASDDINWKEKLAFIYLTPIIYFMMPVLAFVELVALIKSIKNWRQLQPDTNASGAWRSPQRANS